MRHLFLVLLAVPMLMVAGISGYWAVTSSAWWLVGVVASLLLAPELKAPGTEEGS